MHYARGADFIPYKFTENEVLYWMVEYFHIKVEIPTQT